MGYTELTVCVGSDSPQPFEEIRSNMPPDSLNEQKAYHLIENPEFYPGLVPHESSDRHFLLLHYPTFEPHASWSLFQVGDRYWVRRVEWDRSKYIPFHDTDPYTYGSEVRCPDPVAKEAIATLAALSFRPLIKQEGIGLDGTTYGITIGNYLLSCSLRWWCNPPDDWAGVAAWFRTTVEAFEALLPESSCRVVKLNFDF